MKCQHCQADNPEGVRFCGHCGEVILAPLTCPGCGFNNPPDIRFCLQCGHALTRQTSAPTSITAPPASPVPASFANGRYKDILKA